MKKKKEETSDAIPPDKKGKRPDKAAKILLRKTHQETVVKSCLIKYIQGNDEVKTKVKAAISDRVMAFSRRTNLASLALLTILKELFAGKQTATDILTVEIPDMTDQTFIRQLFLGAAKGATKPNAMVISLQSRFPRLFENISRYSADSNIYSAGGTKYITNLKNSLWMNFLPRVIGFTKRFQQVQGLSDEERRSVLYLIMGWNVATSNIGSIFPMRKSVFDAVVEHKKVLGLEPDFLISKEWIEDKENLLSFLRYYVLLNIYYENNDLPTFTLIPVSKVKRHFITIDSFALYGIMKDLELVGCNDKVFIALKMDHWKSFLKVDRLQKCQKSFTGTIETDGVSLCTHFMKPKPTTEAGSSDALYRYDAKKDRVIGFDPGRVNIFYGAEKLEDGTIKKYVLTRKQYYTDMGAIKARKTTETWNMTLKNVLIRMSFVSSKGVDLQNHVQYLNRYFENYDAMWNEYTKERWSRQRMSLYAGKQRVFDRFFNAIKDTDSEKRVVIAYGAASFDPGGKGELSVPTTKAFTETNRRYKTVMVDEFRTSKICYSNDSVLQLVASKKDPKKGLRGLLWCGSTNNNFFIDRDLNAALNIRRCITSPSRPISLTRVPGLVRLAPQVIGNFVKW